jgi:pimeloyl-ACP methyl ester carboxylesterase
MLMLVPHAEIIQFQDCGHFPDLEQPERFANILIERMDEALASSEIARSCEATAC